MRLTSTLAVAVVFGLAGAYPAFGQTVASWQEVQVTPVRPGGGTLLYPGGEYSRNVPPLLYPGERSGPIRLHMPEPRRSRVASAEPRTESRTEPRTESRPVAPRPVEIKPAPKPAPAPKVAKAAPPPPPRPATPAPDVNPFGGATDLSNVFGNAPKTEPKLASNAPPPVRTAPAGPTTGNESL